MNSLSDLIPGETAIVDNIMNDTNMKRRFLDIGLIKGTEVTCVGQSPGNDPKAFLIRGAVIAIRSEDSSKVLIRG